MSKFECDRTNHNEAMDDAKRVAAATLRALGKLRVAGVVTMFAECGCCMTLSNVRQDQAVGAVRLMLDSVESGNASEPVRLTREVQH